MFGGEILWNNPSSFAWCQAQASSKYNWCQELLQTCWLFFKKMPIFGLFFIKKPKQITLISKRFHDKCQHICSLLHLTSRKTRCIDPLWIKILHYIPFCCSTKIRTMLNPSWGTTYGRTIATPIIHRQLASVRHMYILVWVNKNKKNLLFLVCPQLFLWGRLKKVK